jgi:hypothetical protein
VYNVPPYGAHDLNVRFDVSGMKRGETAEVQLGNAILLSGRPTAIEPIVVERQ